MNPSRRTSGKYFTSGAGVTSGQFVTSGVPLGSAVPGSKIFIGEEIDTKAPTAFRLAPRVYTLSCEGDGQRRLSGVIASAMAHFPIQLAFRELGPDERSRQCWSSAGSNPWHWQLVLEQNNESVVVALTASPPPGDFGKRLSWRPTAVWEPFGTNTLRSDSVGNGVPPLVVRAP
jgi:hypothetical protein